jgi:hypothetical protein
MTAVIGTREHLLDAHRLIMNEMAAPDEASRTLVD